MNFIGNPQIRNMAHVKSAIKNWIKLYNEARLQPSLEHKTSNFAFKLSE